MSTNPPARACPSPGDRLLPDEDQAATALLVGRIQCGDESALRSLYDLWAARVYSIAMHLLDDHEEAEDVVELAFSRIWRDARLYDATRGSVGAWIVVIARSHALSRRRARERRTRHDGLRSSHAEMEGRITTASPLLDLEADERRERIDHAVTRLPEEQQRVVRMTFAEGLSQTEIAERLGIPLGTVKTRVRLAFSKLRGLLADLRT